MVRARPTLPAGHGEVVERPPYAEWTALLASNRAASSAWGFDFGGVSAAQMRAQARRDLLEAARGFSEKLGVEVRPPGGADTPIIATGHQPDLYHPGVWVKDFLLDRLAQELDASGVDIVVDSDGFDAVKLTSPCMQPGLARCQQYLAIGAADTCFSFAPVPSAAHLADFCSSGAAMLADLPAPAVRRHFSAFCDALTAASASAGNLAELVTIARRIYESSAQTGYLEAPLTQLARGSAFRRFVATLALDSVEFARAYNAELEEYRGLTKTRSTAQPFPNLEVEGDNVELPLWHLASHRRETVWAQPLSLGGVRLVSAGETVAELPRDVDRAVELLMSSDLLIAPKALALTLFVRMFCCDLFIHGIGGGRYDLVTNGVIRRYFGVEPPAFVVASMTMYLPLGAHVVADEEVAAAKERLNRIEHNPDALLGEVEFETTAERDNALALAAEKRELVARIAAPDADKKAVGGRIREVNAQLAAVLAPLRETYATELAGLEVQQAATEILTDRTYPFCFWDPVEIADKVR